MTHVCTWVCCVTVEWMNYSCQWFYLSVCTGWVYALLCNSVLSPSLSLYNERGRKLHWESKLCSLSSCLVVSRTLWMKMTDSRCCCCCCSCNSFATVQQYYCTSSRAGDEAVDDAMFTAVKQWLLLHKCTFFDREKEREREIITWDFVCYYALNESLRNLLNVRNVCFVVSLSLSLPHRNAMKCVCSLSLSR